MSEKVYMSVKDIVESESYPFTAGQFRCYLQNREKNGLSKAAWKVGKRVVIRKDLFEEWIEEFNNV